jgi:1-acyl-sn-glycerol-3-phosphate acyltransferase
MLYNFIKAIFRVIFSTLYPRDIEGLENIPEEGPLIVCSNHINWVDPALVASMIPRSPVYFMAKEELFNYIILGYLIKRVGAFPVKRDSADLKSIKKALSLLKEGAFIGLFPEGTRSKTGEVGEALPGVALLALKSEAPVMPVAIRGRYRLFRKIRISIGKPMTFAEFYGQKAKRELLADMSKTIMSEIRRLHAGE